MHCGFGQMHCYLKNVRVYSFRLTLEAVSIVCEVARIVREISHTHTHTLFGKCISEHLATGRIYSLSTVDMCFPRCQGNVWYFLGILDLY